MPSLFAPDCLKGKVALVTGASSGLGRDFALTLAAHGAAVVCAARRVDRLADTVADIARAGGQGGAVEMDVTSVASVGAAFDAAEADFGPVTVLVNNAGVASTDRAMELTEEPWDQVLDTNLKGAWHAAQAFGRRLSATGKPGSLVNIASILGLRQAGGVLPYAVSKAGLVQMTQTLALEWARHNIRVNAIAPGYIETDLNRGFLESEAGQALKKRVPQRRFGQPEDLAGALLLLASDASAYMTGAIIAIDGGHLVNTL